VTDVSSNIEIDKRFDRAPDIKDNYLFDLAYSVKSHYIVTNDIPLLNMKQVNKIKLISLRDWETLIENRKTEIVK
jgi:predicted nucleic acid-binding protein